MSKDGFEGIENSLFAMTDIGDDLIMEAIEPKPRKRLRLLPAAAAVIAAAAGAVTAVLLLTGKQEPANVDVSAETSFPTEYSEATGEPQPLPPTDAPFVDPVQTDTPAVTDAPASDAPSGTIGAADTPTATPQATVKATSAPTRTPQATAGTTITPKPTSTPKATSKPTHAPSPTGVPGPVDATSEPGVTPSYYEMTSIDELAEFARSGGLGHNIDKLYVPAGVPEGAKLLGIRANITYVEYDYQYRGDTLKFKWLIHYNAEEYFEKIHSIAPNGAWCGDYYIADGAKREVHWEQYGKVFVAELPLGTDPDFIERFCAAKSVSL